MIIFFVSLFSLDVFEMEATPLELLGAFLIPNLPSITLTLLLVFAWRRPVVGFVAFLLAGLVFLRFVIFDLSLGHFLLFSGPLLLISGLFYADWRWHKPAIRLSQLCRQAKRSQVWGAYLYDPHQSVKSRAFTSVFQQMEKRPAGEISQFRSDFTCQPGSPPSESEGLSRIVYVNLH